MHGYWGEAGGLLALTVPVLLIGLFLLWLGPGQDVGRLVATWGFLSIGGGLTALLVGLGVWQASFKSRPK